MSRRQDGNDQIADGLVVSPLDSFIKDQVKSLWQEGVKASFIGAGQEEANFTEIEIGERKIV